MPICSHCKRRRENLPARSPYVSGMNLQNTNPRETLLFSPYVSLLTLNQLLKHAHEIVDGVFKQFVDIVAHLETFGFLHCLKHLVDDTQLIADFF